jgi:glycosyltransferase involved in cell wall biosynthesis
LPNLELVDFQAIHQLEAILKRWAITGIEIHHLTDLDGSAPESLIQCAHSLGIRLEIFVHDYHAICPRINLVGPKRIYCEEPSERECNLCLAKRVQGLSSPLSKDIRKWRQSFRGLYEGADRVNVPDEDVARRLLRYFKISTVEVRPHEPDASLPSLQPGFIEPNSPLRVVIIGAISVVKGLSVLHACAKDARRRRLPLQFILMGYSQKDKILKQAGVAITGRYNDAVAVNTLLSLKPHLVWLPSVGPETYSYALSLALSNGHPVAAFDIGAIPARLHRAGRDEMIMPLKWSFRPERINDGFMRFKSELSGVDQPPSPDC